MFSGGLASTHRDIILEFDISKQEWTQTGNMSYSARNPGVSEVNFADFEPWCNKRSFKNILPSLPESGKMGDDAAMPT